MQPRVGERWKFCGAKYPIDEIIYFCTELMVYIVVITSIGNLCISDKNTCQLSSLVSGIVGYLLSSAAISNKKRKWRYIIWFHNRTAAWRHSQIIHYKLVSSTETMSTVIHWIVLPIRDRQNLMYHRVGKYTWILQILSFSSKLRLLEPTVKTLSMRITWEESIRFYIAYSSKSTSR